ncbi:MAG: PTS sugar transporter subunit IIC [Gemmatimonadetes bacterium]|nr:PTS sugar transporter subunit IIC [Gemmatimonadota bacterium]
MTGFEVAALLAWGTVVGLDLVSVPQAMISRPLVAATVAGLLLGDPVSGVTVGMMLELFALEVLPVGAARYPDYGPASVASAVVAAGGDPLRAIGLAAAIGLVVAYVGEFTILEVRRRNSRAVARYREGLASGDPVTIRAFHRAGLMRDAARALLLTAAGLALAALPRAWPPLTPRIATLLDAVVIGAGLSAAISGTLRGTGTMVGLRWFAIGLAAGIAVVVLR